MKCILRQSVTEGLRGICQPLYPHTDRENTTTSSYTSFNFDQVFLKAPGLLGFTVCVPLTNLFSTQLFGFGVYQTALDQAEIFPVKSHETLHVHHTDFFSDRLSVFKGKIALCWILSAFAQTLLRTKLFLTKLPASG